MWNVLHGQISNPDDGSLNAADHIKTVMLRVYVPSCRSLNEFSLTSVVGFFFFFRQHSLHGRWSESCQRSDEPLFAVGSQRFPCSKHTSAILDSIPWKVTSHPHTEAQPDTTKWEVFSTFTRWVFQKWWLNRKKISPPPPSTYNQSYSYVPWCQTLADYDEKRVSCSIKFKLMLSKSFTQG